MFIKPIKSGEAEIIEHGSVISFMDDPIEFEIPGLNKDAKIVFTFLTDEKSSEQKMEFALHEQTLEVKLTNINNSIDSGNVNPLDIGELEQEKKTVFLNFRVRKISNTRTLDYTVYKK